MVGMEQDSPDIATLAAVIAHSQIVVRIVLSEQLSRLPAGFDDVDLAILDWIADQGRRANGRFVRM